MLFSVEGLGVAAFKLRGRHFTAFIHSCVVPSPRLLLQCDCSACASWVSQTNEKHGSIISRVCGRYDEPHCQHHHFSWHCLSSRERRCSGAATSLLQAMARSYQGECLSALLLRGNIGTRALTTYLRFVAVKTVDVDGIHLSAPRDITRIRPD